ncbi:tropomyosin alpha-4 chain-like [Ptychodera flava]|uniref:tropomyosin alpha-4 chain-like n=1 Tax=Ptychodera flava TaxID=63121 RepID=UPI00396A7D5A
MTSTGLAKVSQGKKAAEVKERRVDEMLTRSRERVQIQSQIIQDGDLTRALQLSPEERNEVILKLLFQIKEETSKVEPVRKKVLEIESKVSEVEKSLDHAYERIEETEENQQHLKNSETLVHELKVKMDEVEKRMEQMEKKEDDLENRDHGKPRTIKVAFVNADDARKILYAAPGCLKGNKFEGNQIYVTDDVSKKVHAERKTLLQYASKIKKEASTKSCYIAWKVPATLVVKYENGDKKEMRVKDIPAL